MHDIVEDGWFDMKLNAYADSLVPEIIILCVISISLVIQCWIAIATMVQMHRNPNISVHAYICFMLSFAFAFLSTVSDIVRQSWDPTNWERNIGHEIVIFINVFGLGLFYASLLLTYIVRLYSTFNGSVFRMSPGLIVMFVVILVLYVLVFIAFAVLRTFDRLIGSDNSIRVCLLIVCCSLYTIGCVLAVYFFVSNLSKSAKAMVTSHKNVQSPLEIELDRAQQNLSDLSAKYTMLFGMALSSTIIFFFIAWCFPSRCAVREPIWCLDFCVNLWCIYLQFSFARDHYKRCCGWCDGRCRKCERQRTRSLIYHHSIELKLAEDCKAGIALTNIVDDNSKGNEA